MNTSILRLLSHRDQRGVLLFCNEFDMLKVRRLYIIANSIAHPLRGWIGHKKENKWLFPINGITTVTVESMDGVASTSFNLTAANPSILKISAGNWFCIEQHDGAQVMVFSDCKVGEYENDDFRRPI